MFAVSFLCLLSRRVGTQGVVLAKTKTPLFSLGSQGSLANTLTTQKGSSSSILRRKPTPSDPYTLPQAYQRWLYEDYAYLWTKQSAATKAEYRSAGVRYHLTAFQYWMKYCLTNLPDIAAYWKHDLLIGATTPDSSNNANTATVIGASLTAGRIGGALLFDGINDWNNCGHDPSLAFTTELTLCMRAYWNGLPGHQCLIAKDDGGANRSWSLTKHTNPLTTRWFALRTSAGAFYAGLKAITQDTWYDIIITYNGARLKIYFDNTLNEDVPATGTINATPTQDVELSRWVGARFVDGLIDDTILYSRVFDETEIGRYSSRRYPA